MSISSLHREGTRRRNLRSTQGGDTAQDIDDDNDADDMAATAPAVAQTPRVFHERQRLQLCLLHALNNLLQGEKAFTRKELDVIADNLPSIDSDGPKWWSPLSTIFKRHRNIVTGDYDVNVLIAALAERGKEVIWYDRRKGADGLNPMAMYGSRLVGIIVNVPARRFGGLLRSRHWITVRMVDGLWYNLDSDLMEPLLLHHGEEDLKRYLEAVFADTGEALIVVDTNMSSPS